MEIDDEVWNGRGRLLRVSRLCAGEDSREHAENHERPQRVATVCHCYFFVFSCFRGYAFDRRSGRKS